MNNVTVSENLNDSSRIIFTRFVRKGLGLIKQTLSEQWSEDDHLDFKTVERPSDPLSDKPGINKTWAEAMGGFANSGGGVIVWGVLAVKESSDVPDVVVSLHPISNLEVFKSHLITSATCLVDPAIEGIEHHPVLEDGESDKGYLISYIPVSNGPPHLSNITKNHQFVYRAGHSFKPMPHWMIVNKMSLRPLPKLELSYRLTSGMHGCGEYTIHLTIGIGNIGRGIALYPALFIDDGDNVKWGPLGFDGQHHNTTAFPERACPNEGGWRRRFFIGSAHDAIYPDSKVEITTADLEVKGEAETFPDLSIQYEIHCDGNSKRDTLVVPGVEVIACRDRVKNAK